MALSDTERWEGVGLWVRVPVQEANLVGCQVSVAVEVPDALPVLRAVPVVVVDQEQVGG